MNKEKQEQLIKFMNEHPGLQEKLNQLTKENTENINEKTIDELNAAGFEISMDDLKAPSEELSEDELKSGEEAADVFLVAMAVAITWNVHAKDMAKVV